MPAQVSVSCRIGTLEGRQKAVRHENLLKDGLERKIFDQSVDRQLKQLGVYLTAPKTAHCLDAVHLIGSPTLSDDLAIVPPSR